MTASLSRITAIYEGSDGDATRKLYEELKQFGAAGEVAINLFRAHKTSGRAKVYRGGGYRGMAYDRKQWSLDNLCRVLVDHAPRLRLVFGWKIDPAQPKHNQVLYIDLPTGQVSFHAEQRGAGPDYAGDWDGLVGAGGPRVIRYAMHLIDSTAPELFMPPPQRGEIARLRAEQRDDLFNDRQHSIAAAPPRFRTRRQHRG